MQRVMQRLTTTLWIAFLLACGPPPISRQTPAPRTGRTAGAKGAAHVLWQEHFAGPLDWIDPAGHDANVVASVVHVEHEQAFSFLHVVHDARPGDAAKPPAIHFGKAFRDDPVPLERVVELRWRWRVVRHPDVTDDPWSDVAASVYVITKAPGVFAGRGFKFGWLAKPGAEGTTQRGLVQVGLRVGDPSGGWREEAVDVCALYRETFGPCEGEHILYVGIVTDADNTDSLSIADYADFALRAN